MDVTRPSRIEVEIGELVLHGFDATRRHAIGDAVVRELERLLAADAALAAHSSDAIDAGSIRIARGGGADAGRAIARAIHGSLARTGESQGGAS